MLRFLALTGKETSINRSEVIARVERSASGSWRHLFIAAGLDVFVSGDPAHATQRQLHHDEGVVLGALFERNSDLFDDAECRPAELSKSLVRALHIDADRRLVEACWGDYVAFLLDRGARRVRVVRSPTGSLPCHFVRMDGLILFFSHVADLAALGITPLRLNDAYLAARIISGGYSRAPAAIEGVVSFTRGECVEVDLCDEPEVVRRTLCWHPHSYLGSTDYIEDPDLAVRAMSAVIRSCTHTWAARYPRILHRLSGGLDSSIVLACIRTAPSRPDIAAYTYYTPGGRFDERVWARLAARGAVREHIELPLDPVTFDLGNPPALPLSMEPLSLVEFVHRERNERPLAYEHCVDAIFCGEGGDSGFGKHSIAFSLLQYFQRHGLGPLMLGIAADVALYTQQTAWSVLFRSARRWLLGSRMSDQRNDLLAGTRLVNPELARSVSRERRYPHPWFESYRDVPWATISQLGMLPYAVEFADDAILHPHGAPIVSPLYSQPVIELLLRIPLYVHFDSGRERGLARRAFAGQVPAPILQRLWKDRAPGLEQRLIALQREAIREILLDGVLVREQFLDRVAVETALCEDVSKSEVLPGEIFKYVDIEMWARNWRSHTSEVARAHT